MKDIPGAGRREGSTVRDGVRLVAQLCSLGQHPWVGTKPSLGGTAGAEGPGSAHPASPSMENLGARGETAGAEGKGCSQSGSKGCGKAWQWGAQTRVTPPPWGEEEKHPEDGKRKDWRSSNKALAPPWFHLSFQIGWVKFYRHRFVKGRLFWGEKGDLG